VGAACSADLRQVGLNGGVRGKRARIILYGDDVDAVAESLRALDPRYVLGDRVPTDSRQVPVLRCPHGAAADAFRRSAPEVAWLVVELYRPGVDVVRAGDPVFCLNSAKVDPGSAARAIAQPDLVVWYEVINPVRVTTVDAGPVADDYSNVAFVVPDGHRQVAHAVRTGAAAPPCLPADAELVLRSDDLFALAVPSRKIEVCQACAVRHR
jgi:hypothetical protein